MNLDKCHFNLSAAGYCGISKNTIILSSAFVAETALRRTVLSLCFVSRLCPSNSSLLEKKSKKVSHTRTSLSFMQTGLLDSNNICD
jgi:hypothetical protein